MLSHTYVIWYSEGIPTVELKVKRPGTYNANEVSCEYQSDDVLCSQLLDFGGLGRRGNRPLPCILQRLPHSTLPPAPPSQQRTIRGQAVGLPMHMPDLRVLESQSVLAIVRQDNGLVANPMA
jgi:hypothetical protein